MHPKLSEAFTKGVALIEQELIKKYSPDDLDKGKIYKVTNFMCDGNPVQTYTDITDDKSVTYVYVLTMDIGMGFTMKLRIMRKVDTVEAFYTLIDELIPKLLKEVETKLGELDEKLKKLSEDFAKMKPQLSASGGRPPIQAPVNKLVNPVTGLPFGQ